MGLTALLRARLSPRARRVPEGRPAPSRGRSTRPTPSIWGPFHFWLEALLRAGWRPRLKAELDEHERQALRTRRAGALGQLGGDRVLPRAVRVRAARPSRSSSQAVRRGARERAAGPRRGLGVLVVVAGPVGRHADLLRAPRSRRRSTSPIPRSPTVWAEAGVTNRQLNRELARFGLCMPWNVVLENVRVAGIASTGTHGTGKATATVGDLVEAFEVVDAEGRLRVLSEETVGAEVMSAARLGLGLFGVIARVRLRVVPHPPRAPDRPAPPRAPGARPSSPSSSPPTTRWSSTGSPSTATCGCAPSTAPTRRARSTATASGSGRRTSSRTRWLVVFFEARRRASRPASRRPSCASACACSRSARASSTCPSRTTTTTGSR